MVVYVLESGDFIMVEQLKKTGVYLFAVKGIKKADQIYLDQNYQYAVYHFSKKKDFEQFTKDIEGLKLKDIKKILSKYLVEECNDLLPDIESNCILFTDSTFKNIDKKQISDKKPNLTSFDKDKFYSIVLKNICINDLIFFDKDYDQEVYEFNSKEDLMRFISGDLECKPVDVVTSTIAQKNFPNVFYVAKDEVQTKLIEYGHILDPKVFFVGSNGGFRSQQQYLTKIVFWPSMDTYIYNCHEDAIIECASDSNDFMELNESRIDMFIKKLESWARGVAYGDDYEPKYQYVGKSYGYNPEDDNSTIGESSFLICDYLYFGHIIETKEQLDWLENNRKNNANILIQEINKKRKASELEALKFAKVLLAAIKIFEPDGSVNEFYKDLFDTRVLIRRPKNTDL